METTNESHTRTAEMDELLNSGTWVKTTAEEFEEFKVKMNGVYTDEDVLKPGFIFGEVTPNGYIFWKRLT